jgi:PAS domain S-box-containing protein
MGYTVLCFYRNKELLQCIETVLGSTGEKFTVYGVECCHDDNLLQHINSNNPNAVIFDYSLGVGIIQRILSSPGLDNNDRKVPFLLALPVDHQSNNEIDILLHFDDFFDYPCISTTFASRLLLSIDRRKSLNKLYEESEQFRDISLAASKAGSSLIIIDKTGEIVWVNEGFELLYESNLQEFINRFGDNVFTSELNPLTASSMKRCAEEGVNVVYESLWFTDNNKRKSIQTSLTPIYDSSGKFSKIIAIETDITDLKLVQEALNDKQDNMLSVMEHLEDANRMLDEQRIEIERQKASLEEEKNKSDALLLNILPEVAAHQLKKKGFVKPKKYNEVSVLFADFVNFSSLSVAYNSIEEFLAALSFYFEEFDEITTKRFIEKIKTIGDCYMCVGGVPQGNKSHPFDSVLAALEIQKFVEDKAQIDQANGLPVWRLRIGIHSGSVMAGVIGKKKFAYDVWGDTVNVASRMESKGEAGKVNISETTYLAIQDFFKCTYRGKVVAKNIGEINMYFVERILPEYSEDQEGFTPNAAFRKELAKY